VIPIDGGAQGLEIVARRLLADRLGVTSFARPGIVLCCSPSDEQPAILRVDLGELLAAPPLRDWSGRVEQERARWAVDSVLLQVSGEDFVDEELVERDALRGRVLVGDVAGKRLLCPATIIFIASRALANLSVSDNPNVAPRRLEPPQIEARSPA
jgi:hypothetical protein